MTRRLAAVVAAIAVLAAACSSGAAAPQPSELHDKPTGGRYQGFGLTPPQPRPSFTLTDTTGKPFAFGTGYGGQAHAAVLRLHALPGRLPDDDGRHRSALRTVPAPISSDAPKSCS